MKTFAAVAFVLVLASALCAGQTTSQKALQIYFIDMEGGASTLFVTPSGQSLLMDTGNQGGRDSDRIMAAIHDAGLQQIDYVVLTHYHVDHVGGFQELAKQIPMKHFIDHGPTVEPREQVANFQANYAELYNKASHTVVKPGDKIPITGMDVVVLTSATKILKTPLPGAGKPNPECSSFVPRDESHVTDPENEQSVGLHFTMGKFRMVNMGDFTWNSEKELMCPNNPIGTVDLFLTSHHGIERSNAPVLVHALAPRVAIMNNGSRKGGVPQTMQTLWTSPGLEDVWQLHWAYAGGLEENAPGRFIANIEDPAALAASLTGGGQQGQGIGGGMGQGRGAGAPGAAPGAPPQAPTPGAPAAAAGTPGGMPGGMPGGARGGMGGFGGGRGGHTGPAFWIKVTARADGSFTVLNTRNNFSKDYAAKK